MKKEIDQAEKRAKEKKALETSLHYYKKAVTENEANIAKLESDLEKLSELRTKEEENHKAELETTRKAVRAAAEYCARRFAVFSETLSSELCDIFLENVWYHAILSYANLVLVQRMVPTRMP